MRAGSIVSIDFCDGERVIVEEVSEDSVLLLDTEDGIRFATQIPQGGQPMFIVGLEPHRRFVDRQAVILAAKQQAATAANVRTSLPSRRLPRRRHLTTYVNASFSSLVSWYQVIVRMR